MAGRFHFQLLAQQPVRSLAVGLPLDRYSIRRPQLLAERIGAPAAVHRTWLAALAHRRSGKPIRRPRPVRTPRAGGLQPSPHCRGRYRDRVLRHRQRLAFRCGLGALPRVPAAPPTSCSKQGVELGGSPPASVARASVASQLGDRGSLPGLVAWAGVWQGAGRHRLSQPACPAPGPAPRARPAAVQWRRSGVGIAQHFAAASATWPAPRRPQPRRCSSRRPQDPAVSHPSFHHSRQLTTPGWL